jgi:hypothetical protein
MKPYEPGVLVEFYLPKKASYQGPLHDRLKDALYIDRVRSLLRKRKAEILPTLQVLLARRGGGEEDWEEILRSIPEEILGGWSMYEVDGVFIDRERLKNKENEHTSVSDSEDAALFEERTQVVRLILYPGISNVQLAGQGCSSDSARGLADAFMHHPTARSADFLKDHGEFWEQKFPDRQTLELACRYMEKWITAAGVLVFGYLVWAISDAIGPKEKVFWVTASWGLNINQVELDGIHSENG